jgi:hypothetical protein
MMETLNTKLPVTDQSAQGTTPAAQNAIASPAPSMEHTKIKSNFTQSPSTYWALALPLLSARYAAEAINGLVKPLRKFNAKNVEAALEETATKAEFKDKAWAFLVGLGMVGVTSFYTASTYGDMKRQFKEALGWEFQKDPEKVGFIDMMRSKNVLVHDAAKNLTSRTAKRFAMHIPFFFMFMPTPFRVTDEKVAFDGWFSKKKAPITIGDTVYDKLLGPTDSVKLGVGTNAFYLASDALGRRRTFYEELQRVIDNKINHKDTLGQEVTTQDLINLYDRQARRKGAELPKMNSKEWQNDVKLFARMADLMNQTYENTPRKEYADFTMPKLIFLLGMKMIQSENPEQNLAYVEVANRYGIPAVKKVAADVRNGMALNAALAAYPVAPQEPALPVTEADNAMLKSMGIAPEPVAPPAQKSFASEGLIKPRPEAPPATHAEKAAKAEGAMALGT